MIYLGANRIVTNSYQNHKTAEDYAGMHKSDVKINGIGKVIRIINRFHSHEDSINYYDFLDNKEIWDDGKYYNCISITKKQVRMHKDELGGNQIWIETYDGDKKIILHLAHLDSILVSVGDIVNQDTVIAKQGNTGLVLSDKALSDLTYGSHIHLEVVDQNKAYINPRGYADGSIITTYLDKDLPSAKNLEDSITESSNLEINQDHTLPVNNDEKINHSLIFTCPKEAYYYIKLYPGEKLYLEKKE